jgi:hypothetical protein
VFILFVAAAIYPTSVFVNNRLTLKNTAIFNAKPQTLASATTLTLPEGTTFRLTGTAKCTRILPAGDDDSGRIVIFYHTAADTFVDATNADTLLGGKNLILSGDFNATKYDMIMLQAIDTFWVEISEEVN